MKSALVLGAGGFIGHHLSKRLKDEGFFVRGADLKIPSYEQSYCDEFLLQDLTNPHACKEVIDKNYDEIYQLAADMGGAGYIFSGDNDAKVMHNSATINLNVAQRCAEIGGQSVFYSSSACIYPEHNQLDPLNPNCEEKTAYPANPDSEYGWEKLFSERLYLSYNRNFKCHHKIARYHNIFGPLGAWNNGKEKSPAAICRKIAMANNGGSIEIWGDGTQTRSFLYVDECLEGTCRLYRSNMIGPYNIGSDEMISINDFVDLVADIAGKTISKVHVPGPLGVMGRNSDNKLIYKELHWKPTSSLKSGVEKLYEWIESQVVAGHHDPK